MFRAAGDAAGWAAGFLTGGVWGVVLFSWALPLPLPMRYAATILLVVTLAATSRNGMLAAGAFALGMGASSSLLLASSGLLLADWWGLVSAAALLGGVVLHAGALLSDPL
jgi:hypothetical protein